MTKDRVIVIANKPVKDYYWILGLEFMNANQVTLHAIDLYLPTVERLIRLYESLGVEEYGDRGEKITTTNTKTGKTIEVNVIILRKLGAIL